MAWVRVHDGALSHPKLVGLIDWKNPFCVWVWGLSYCQMHLTDGAIPKAALPNTTAVKAAARLVADRLWKTTPTGFQVHDYLDWNDSREIVEKRKAGAKSRKENWKDKQETERRSTPRTERVPNAAPSRIAGTDNQTKPNQTKPERAKDDAREDPNDENGHPVAKFMRVTYPALYAKARNGAAYRLNESRDFEVCMGLVDLYGDRLPLMLEYFLNMPPGKDVLNQPGTPRQFQHMAPMVDAELRRHGR